MRDSVRIERLRVKARGRRGVPLVQSVVEDAFRTQLSAAGPAVQRGLLVIRKMDLGPIASRRDHAVLKLRLAAGLRDAVRKAGRFDPERDVTGDAVLFPDPLYPFVHIARCLGLGRPVPQGWPWRAVLGRALFAPRAQLAAELVVRPLGTPQAGPAVRTVLKAFGPAFPDIATAWPNLLCQHAFEAISVGQSGAANRKVAASDMVGLAQDLRALAANAVFLSVLVRWQRDPAPALRVLPLAVACHLGSDSRPVEARRVAVIAALLSRIVEQRAVAERPSAQLHRLAGLAEVQAAALSRLPGDAASGMSPTEFARTIGDVCVGGDRDDLAPIAIVRNVASPPPVTERPALEQRSDEPLASDLPISSFAPTRYGGIAYLIALIQRCYGGWLGGGEHLAAGIGQQLLLKVMRRLGPDPCDAVQGLLATLDDFPAGEAAPIEFRLVRGMLRDEARPVGISAIAGHRGWRLAKSGRLVLACWQGRAPPAVRRLIEGGQGFVRCAPVTWSSDAMLASCEIGLRRYLRSGPRLRMAQLVQRGGELACTATHLDIAFDASVIDLTIRRWALDLSPGWCPWLWRVVTIHYDFGDDDAA